MINICTDGNVLCPYSDPFRLVNCLLDDVLRVATLPHNHDFGLNEILKSSNPSMYDIELSPGCAAMMDPTVSGLSKYTVVLRCDFLVTSIFCVHVQYTRYPSTARGSSLAVNDSTLDVRVTSDRPITP